MIKVYFQNSQRQEREIGQAKDQKEVDKIISKFLEDHNYKSYYTRIWNLDDGSTMYDVGSWSEFFRSKEE